MSPTEQIIAKFHPLEKSPEIRCPRCHTRRFWKHGFYYREPTVPPDNARGKLRIQRYLCKNPGCSPKGGTFSILPFPILPRIGVPMPMLMDILKAGNISLSLLFARFLEWPSTTLRRWKKWGNRWLQWLDKSAVFSEKLLNWPLLAHLTSVKFYPRSLSP